METYDPGEGPSGSVSGGNNNGRKRVADFLNYNFADDHTFSSSDEDDDVFHQSCKKRLSMVFPDTPIQYFEEGLKNIGNDHELQLFIDEQIDRQFDNNSEPLSLPDPPDSEIEKIYGITPPTLDDEIIEIPSVNEMNQPPASSNDGTVQLPRNLNTLSNDEKFDLLVKIFPNVAHRYTYGFNKSITLQQIFF